MRDVFILRLQGVLQAWGGHTFEDFRPVCPFPTRSGLAGLLGACLGVRRTERERLLTLANGFIYCARLDRSEHPVFKLLDFHTIENARKADGKIEKNPVVSRREYLCDAKFTVALALESSFPCAAGDLKAALKTPVFTPFLGRRSCPPSRPLFECILEAAGLREALTQVSPGTGVLYSDEETEGSSRLAVRDVPFGETRRFRTRDVFIHAG